MRLSLLSFVLLAFGVVGSTLTIASEITTALTGLITDVTGYITVIAPVALGVAAVVIGWKYAVRLVKRI